MIHPINHRRGLARRRVGNGARWLDESFPGWEDRIDPRTLEMRNGSKCICGQVFKGQSTHPGYYFAKDTLFTEAADWISSIVRMKAQGEDGNILFGLEAEVRAERVAKALGFQATFFRRFGSLQKEWQRLLGMRAQARAAEAEAAEATLTAQAEAIVSAATMESPIETPQEKVGR